jgi:hypothetical protein
MNTPTQAAQVEQHQTTRLNIDFSHRLSWAFHRDDFSAYSASIAVDDMVDRALATLTMLQSQFMGEEDCRLNDEIIYNVIETSIKEIEDIKSIVDAFRKSAHLAKQNQQA